MGVPETLLDPWRDSSRGPALRVRKMTAAPQTKGLETYCALTVQPQVSAPWGMSSLFLLENHCFTMLC